MSDKIDSAISLDEMRRTLYSAVVCDALDALGYRKQSPLLRFPVRTTAAGVLVGRCKTTLWEDSAGADPDPYAEELAAVDSCTADDVVIVAARSLRSGTWGELLSTAARNAGCVGAIVDGCVRDVAMMRAMGFAVFARSTSPRDSRDRQRVIEYDVPVEIEGVTFRPGELVFADEDGVVVVPRQIEREALESAWKKVHEESEVREAIAAGMKAAEAYARYRVL